MKSYRGQMFSGDLVMSMLIFLMVLGIFTTTWTFNKNRMDESAWSQEIEKSAHTAADILVNTPGSPDDWERNPALMDANNSIGLAWTDRTIDADKLDQLENVDADLLKELLHVGQNNVTVLVKDPEGNLIKRVGKSRTSEYGITSSRVVTYDGRAAILEVTVWGSRNLAGVII